MCKRLHSTWEVYPNSNGLETIYNLAGASAVRWKTGRFEAEQGKLDGFL